MPLLSAVSVIDTRVVVFDAHVVVSNPLNGML
jgi:hypothetical protein